MLLTIILVGCSSRVLPPDAQQITNYYHAGNYKQVVSALDKHAWTTPTDVDLLFNYCEAQFQVSSTAQTCKLDRSSAPQAVLFADAFWSVRTGRIQSARESLEKLSSEKEWAAFRTAGLLDLATRTENHVELSSLLKSLESTSGTDRSLVEDLARSFEIQLAGETGDWETLQRVLNEYSRATILGSPVLFSRQVELLIANGRLTEAAKEFDDASADLRVTALYNQSRAYYLWVMGREEERRAMIREYESLHSGEHHFSTLSALEDLLEGSKERVSAANAYLEGLLDSNPDDVRMALDIGIALYLHRQPDQAAKASSHMGLSETDLNEFAAYHVLSAWNAVYRGDLDGARGQLARALRMSPRHSKANYLKALIAKRQVDQLSGMESLKILIAADPYNENFRAMIEDFRNKFPTSDWESLYLESAKRVRRGAGASVAIQ